MDTVIFVPDLIEYAFVGVSLSDANLWEDSIKMNHAMRFTNVCNRQITGICTIILRPEKACLKLFCA